MLLNQVQDDLYMRMALREAEQALSEDEVPIGAVVSCNNVVIGKGHNMVERLQDATAHAEMIAITAASEYLNSKYLQDCTLYVTLEPCLMCASALSWSQLGRVVFGASDQKKGFSIYGDGVLHPKTEVSGPHMEAECAELLQEFFRMKRKG